MVEAQAFLTCGLALGVALGGVIGEFFRGLMRAIRHLSPGAEALLLRHVGIGAVRDRRQEQHGQGDRDRESFRSQSHGHHPKAGFAAAVATARSAGKAEDRRKGAPDQQHRFALLASQQSLRRLMRLGKAGLGGGTDALAAGAVDIVVDRRQPPVDPHRILELGIDAPRHHRHPGDDDRDEVGR